MTRILYRPPAGTLRTDLTSADLAVPLKEPAGLLWVDLSGEPSDEFRSLLLDTFGFHPLAVDDALEETHVPKLDDWVEYLYLVLHAVVFDAQGHAPRTDGPIDTLELDIFLGQNYLVTYHAQPIAAVDRVWSSCQRDERHLKRGAAYLLYKLADELVADYMPAVEQMDDAIDLIEDEIFDNPAPTVLERTFAFKRALLHLRRIIMPQREVLNKLARDDYAVIAAEHRIFFRDVYDHLVRLYDITESMRDLVGGVLDTYLSVVNNRMNEIMKTLTIITTLFMPLAFLTGFFGMNFFQPVTPLGIWTGLPAFLLTLGVMALVPVGMFLWMRRRAWM
ncbi:MAG: magnesium/cobalt transporter CorA [Chloroflexi bacterium]|nr:magnesium/cobalt transporter CorA [Chloroflexota bacterium]MBU1747718.1 magnesium/cobalt transporter CorA [Chloroflexota bacterium]